MKAALLLPTAARPGQRRDRGDESWMGLGGGVPEGAGLNLASLGKGGPVSHPSFGEKGRGLCLGHRTRAGSAFCYSGEHGKNYRLVGPEVA